ncbi:NAD(P)-dependent alcohol dehydrogenase [Streptomyces sp. NPDC127068]|uniref:NAD(P)-dependent alcohol dehydrogenase n=1 Tax=Streptomyces sp. NPDC127068 TaxID=3347127 RepID=UPI003657362A
MREHSLPFEISEAELAEPAADEVLVRIAGVGFCRTDLMPRDPVYGIAMPVVLGHEGSGTVESVGAAVTDIIQGDRVVMSFDSCGVCRACRVARPANCASFFARNLTGRSPEGTWRAHDPQGEVIHMGWFGQSSFATYAVAKARSLVKVPDRGLPLALLGPLGCGFQTGAGSILESLRVRAGTSLVVAGTGAVGLTAVMTARLCGAAPIIAVDLNPARRRLALELGATHALDVETPLLPEAIRRITGGQGADYTLDTTGAPAVITAMILALHSHGTCGLVGVQKGDFTVDPWLVSMGRTIHGIIEGDSVPHILIPRLVSLWEGGRLPFDRLIRTYPLDDIRQAEEDMRAGEVVKAVLLPG